MSGLSCMWYLVPWPGIEPGTLALGAWSLSYWSISEVSCNYILMFIYIVVFIYQDYSNCTQKYTSITLKTKTKKPRAINVISNPPIPTLFIERLQSIRVCSYSEFPRPFSTVFKIWHNFESNFPSGNCSKLSSKIRTTGLQSGVSDDFI